MYIQSHVVSVWHCDSHNRKIRNDPSGFLLVAGCTKTCWPIFVIPEPTFVENFFAKKSHHTLCQMFDGHCLDNSLFPSPNQVFLVKMLVAYTTKSTNLCRKIAVWAELSKSVSLSRCLPDDIGTTTYQTGQPTTHCPFKIAVSNALDTPFTGVYSTSRKITRTTIAVLFIW